MAEFTTILDAMTVMIRLGIHPHEAAPQRVIVSVEMTVAYPQPLGEDVIDQVLDYDFVRNGIMTLAAERRFALQETLCETIAALCLGDNRVTRVRVRTMKTDVYPDAGIGCEVVRSAPVRSQQSAVVPMSTSGTFTRISLEADGFTGWIPFSEVRSCLACPSTSGVYAAAYFGHEPPSFSAQSVGGWFKGNDPTVSTDKLAANWVEGAQIIYLGKANDLRRRLRQFADFGAGKPVGHWGGRLVWQIAAPQLLRVAWKVTPGLIPLKVQSGLLEAFRNEYGKPPFANSPHTLGR